MYAFQEKNVFYLLYHHLLDWLFDILDFLSLVTINQHYLKNEYIFDSS